MSDILKRLRDAHPFSQQYANGSMILSEAADEIETLRQRVRDLEAGFDRTINEYETELATLKQGQGEPVAWRKFDGEGGFEYATYEGNEHWCDWYSKRDDFYKGWCEPLYTSAPTIPAVTKPERDDYCGSCGEWLGGPVICCHHSDEKPAITKTEAKALRATLSAAPKPGEPA